MKRRERQCRERERRKQLAGQRQVFKATRALDLMFRDAVAGDEKGDPDKVALADQPRVS